MLFPVLTESRYREHLLTIAVNNRIDRTPLPVGGGIVIEHSHLWMPGDGYLYDVKISSGEDTFPGGRGYQPVMNAKDIRLIKGRAPTVSTQATPLTAKK